MATREVQRVVEGPALPREQGASFTFNEIVAIYPDDGEPVYHYGYTPDGTEPTERLPFGPILTGRLVDYYGFFKAEENLGHNDCFSLVSHLSSGQPLETIRGHGLDYRLNRSVSVVLSTLTVPGDFYFTGNAEAAEINHGMVGLGGGRVLAKFGKSPKFDISISSIDVAMRVYGGSLMRLGFGGQLRRDA